MDNRIPITFVCLVLLSINASALDVKIIPTGTINIPPQYCESMEYIAIFNITNRGDGGVLCFYTNDSNSKAITLTEECISPNKVQYNLNIPITSHKDKLTGNISLNCYDFYDLSESLDTCDSSYDNSDAKKNAYSSKITILYFKFDCGSPDYSESSTTPNSVVPVSNKTSNNLESISNSKTPPYDITIPRDWVFPIGVIVLIFILLAIAAGSDGSGDSIFIFFRRH